MKKKPDPKHLEAYDATQTSPHRKAPPRKIVAADNLLDKQKRDRGAALVDENITNSAFLAWVIRKHLDYVSRFEINFRSGNEDLDREVQSILQWHRRKSNFDVGRRHSRDDWMRLFETTKVVRGDAAGIMVEGGYMQGLDTSRISLPDDWSKFSDNDKIKKVTKHGLILDQSTGAVLEYCICTRNDSGRLVFDHFEPAENIVYDGYFTGFDQTRAPSPLLAAMNDVIDMDDIRTYTKINVKLQNLFGIAIFRDSADPFGGQVEDDDEDSTVLSDTTISPEQINILDLDAADKVEPFSLNNPGGNTMEFLNRLAQIVMLSLDIPLTSLDGSKASFSARIADRAEYEESAEAKREKNADVLREIYAWRLGILYATNQQFRAVVDRAGYDVGMIVRRLDILAAGTPWMDKLNEVKGDILAVSLGLESIPRLARKRGTDAYQIGAEQAEYLKLAEVQGLPIFYAAGGQESVQNILGESDNGQNNQ
jgi:hypothetical protein